MLASGIRILKKYLKINLKETLKIVENMDLLTEEGILLKSYSFTTFEK